jgi:transcriptional regulator with XRE-family HTH domain
MPYLSNFSDYISEQVLKQGTSLFELSKRIGVDDSAIHQWQVAKFMPSTENLVKVADYFNVPIDYMLGLSDSQTLIRFEPPKSFIDQLSFLMKSKSVTAYRLAKECGFGRAAVSKWLTGQRVPYFESIIKLALFFGCSTDFIIGRAH